MGNTMRNLIVIASLLVVAGCSGENAGPTAQFADGWTSYVAPTQSFRIEAKPHAAGDPLGLAATECLAMGASLPTEQQWVIVAEQGFYGVEKPVASEWFSRGWYVPQVVGGSQGTFVYDPPPANIKPAFRCVAPISD